MENFTNLSVIKKQKIKLSGAMKRKLIKLYQEKELLTMFIIKKIKNKHVPLEMQVFGVFVNSKNTINEIAENKNSTEEKVLYIPCKRR